MKGLFPVFKFEFLNRISQKSIRVTTVIFALLLLGITFVPRFFDVFGSIESIATNNPNSKSENIGYLVENNSIDEETISSTITFGKPVKFNSEKELKNAVNNEDISYGYIFESKNHFKEIAKNTSLYNNNSSIIQENLSISLRNEVLKDNNIDINIVNEASTQIIDYETVELGKSASSGIVFAYIGMFIVYMIVLLFGNSVATLVAREKNDRTMEILITTTSAKNLIVGKVLASTLTSFLQIFIILSSLVIGFFVNKSFYPTFLVNMITKGIGLDSIGIFLLFTVLGCLMYFFLYAAFGALVSKVEEVGNATMPIQLIFVAGFIITSSTMQFPNSIAMKIASIVPFTSPLSFFVRYSMSSIPMYQIILSISLLLLTTLVLAIISIKIYRMGTLNYGNRMGFINTVKKIIKKEE